MILPLPPALSHSSGRTTKVASTGRTVKVKVGPRGGSPYSLSLSGGVQATLPIMDTAPKKQSKRELLSCSREERRRLFDERLPFKCGLLLPERKPVVYTPTEDGGWKNSMNGQVIPHDQLQSYLKHYKFI
jgi:hypothetical protein